MKSNQGCGENIQARKPDMAQVCFRLARNEKLWNDELSQKNEIFQSSRDLGLLSLKVVCTRTVSKKPADQL